MNQQYSQNASYNIDNSPSARFGHTITLISKTKSILFGGALGDSGKFLITNETFLYDLTF